jgi:hypothetical protein
MIVEIIIDYQYCGGKKANSCNPFQNAFPSVSSGPWIPIMPDSDEGPNLDKEWEENNHEDNSSSHAISSRRKD